MRHPWIAAIVCSCCLMSGNAAQAKPAEIKFYQTIGYDALAQKDAPPSRMFKQGADAKSALLVAHQGSEFERPLFVKLDGKAFDEKPGVSALKLAPGKHQVSFSWGSSDPGEVRVVELELKAGHVYVLRSLRAEAGLWGATWASVSVHDWNDPSRQLLGTGFTDGYSFSKAMFGQDSDPVPLVARLGCPSSEWAGDGMPSVVIWRFARFPSLNPVAACIAEEVGGFRVFRPIPARSKDQAPDSQLQGCVDYRFKVVAGKAAEVTMTRRHPVRALELLTRDALDAWFFEPLAGATRAPHGTLETRVCI